MAHLFWLSHTAWTAIEAHLPHGLPGKPRVDDWRVLSGIIFFNRNGLRWRDAPAEVGPSKTLYNRWKRWSEMGVFARMMEGLTAEAEAPKTIMIDATTLKAHRTASSLRSKRGAMGAAGASSGAHRAGRTPSSTLSPTPRTAPSAFSGRSVPRTIPDPSKS